MGSRFHYLITLTYRPRILVYSFTGLILGSTVEIGGNAGWLLWLVLYTFVYPHLVCWGAGTFLRERPAILRLQYLDSLNVGVFCAAVGFSPMPSVGFLSALVMSNLILAGMRSCVVGVFWMIAGSLAVVLVGGTRVVAGHEYLTGLLSGVSILLYSGLIAHLGFKQISGLISGHHAISSTNVRLHGVTEKLRKYIAPQLYETIFLDNSEVSVRSCRKKLVIFFSDIEGFTELTDNMEAEALTVLLNEYLREMAEIAMAHGGTIDKFMGDGIMVFFGDPVSNGTTIDALACVHMALEMRERLQSLRSRWAAAGLVNALHVRIGINTGYCTVGNFGCDARLDYTIIGSAVNLASRLETSAGRDEILISVETYAQVKDEVDCSLRRQLVLKGVARPVDAYVVNGKHGESGAIFARQVGGLSVTLDPRSVEPDGAVALLQETLDEIHRIQIIQSHLENRGAVLRVLK